MDAADHGRSVLGAVFSNTKALDYVAARIGPDHFVDPVQKVLFVLAQRYADQTGGVLTRQVLTDLLRGREPGKALMYAEYFDACVPPDDLPSFKHSVSQLRDLAAERATGQVLAQGMEVLRHGAKGDRGEELRGHADARSYVMSALAAVERESGLEDTPEGDIRSEVRDIHSAYATRKANRLKGAVPGVLFGIDELDLRMEGGLNDGELALVAAWTSAGKTSFCASWAWHASVMQGKNVVIFTSETLRSQVGIKIVSRHSRLPRFGLERGINSRDIRAGHLPPEQEDAFTTVLDDFSTNSDYGHCYIVQVPRGCTVPVIESRLAAISRQFSPQFVVIDYLQLLHPERYRREAGEREDMSSVVRDTKELATTFGGGRGVPVVSPWQVNREGRKNLKEGVGYSLLDLSATAEAGNTPDVVLALADPAQDESHGRAVHIKLSVPKNRDGERGMSVELTADFATSYFAAGPRTTGEQVAKLWER